MRTTVRGGHVLTGSRGNAHQCHKTRGSVNGTLADKKCDKKHALKTSSCNDGVLVTTRGLTAMVVCQKGHVTKYTNSVKAMTRVQRQRICE